MTPALPEFFRDHSSFVVLGQALGSTAASNQPSGGLSNRRPRLPASKVAIL